MSGSELSAELTMSHTRPFTPLHLRVPREPRGQRCVAGCRPQGGKESDTTEATWQARPRGDALQTPEDVAEGSGTVAQHFHTLSPRDAGPGRSHV